MTESTTNTPGLAARVITRLKGLVNGDLSAMPVQYWIKSFEKIPVATPGREIMLEKLKAIQMAATPEKRSEEVEKFVKNSFTILDVNASVKNAPEAAAYFFDPVVLRKVAAKADELEYPPTILAQRSKALSSAESTHTYARGGKIFFSMLAGLLAGAGAVKIALSRPQPAPEPTHSAIVTDNNHPTDLTSGMTDAQVAYCWFLMAAVSATGIKLGQIFEQQGDAEKMALNLVSALDGLTERELGKLQAEKPVATR